MLPRLCYIGPELRDSIAGPGQLFRLLSSYPPNRLLTVQSPLADRQVRSTLHDPTVRLPSFPALRSPRARTLYELTFLFGRSVWAAWLQHRLRHLPCDAVLSLAHGWLCEPALEFARRQHVPFYLILHDHPRTTLPVPRALAKYRLGRWRRLCRAAAACLCISPFMAEHVQRLTGRTSPVLYPGVAPGSRLAAWEAPSHDAPLTFAFAGSFHGPYRALLETLARELASSGHRLLLHSPDSHRLAAGPANRAATDAGWVPPHDLAATLRAEADVLFLPMSFLRADRSNMRVAFPSKLAEYCAAGRPVLVWGPPYSSACRWAKAHAGFAEVVDTLSISDLRQALARLSADPHRRRRMGQESLRLALQFFSHEKTFATFIAALSNIDMRSQIPKPTGQPVTA